MANHKSAAKRARQTEKRELRNRGLRSKVRTTVRRFRETLDAKDADAALNALKAASREIYRASSKGIFHKRTADRQVSRLTLAFNKLKAS